MSQHRIHLVGSLNTASAAESFTLAADLIKGDLPRIPDGEVGVRYYWLNFQGDKLEETLGLERIPGQPINFGGFDARPLQLDGTVPLADLTIGNLGYADAALDSYRTFAQFKAAGRFPAATRFQISLPTPLAVVASYIIKDQQRALLPKYETAMKQEIERILTYIPTDQLAIQFDVAVEFIYIEGINLAKYEGAVPTPWFGDRYEAAADLLAEMINFVPDEVQVGIHLCYGDIGEAHFVQPTDTGNMTRFLGSLLPRLRRPLTWVHLPVPIERTDSAYFEPLTGVQLPAATELFLGLIHREDGEAGITARETAAKHHLPEFGIATECGFGRGPITARDNLFRLHR